MPLGRIQTVNAQAFMPQADVMQGNPVQEGYDKQQAVFKQQDQERAAADEKRANQEREGWQRMMQAPEQAEIIARQYNIPYDQNIDRIVKDKQLNAKVQQSMSEVDKLGIKNPETIKKYMIARMDPQSDPLGALSAIEGMDFTQPEPMTDYQRARLDIDRQRADSYDRRTQAIVSKGRGGAGGGSGVWSKIAPPKGYIPGPDGVSLVQATTADGKPITPDMYGTEIYEDQRIPLNLRLKLKSAMENQFTSILNQNIFTELEKEIQPYLNTDGVSYPGGQTQITPSQSNRPEDAGDISRATILNPREERESDFLFGLD